jgi:hypothetical protein
MISCFTLPNTAFVQVLEDVGKGEFSTQFSWKCLFLKNVEAMKGQIFLDQ